MTPPRRVQESKNPAASQFYNSAEYAEMLANENSTPKDSSFLSKASSGKKDPGTTIIINQKLMDQTVDTE